MQGSVGRECEKEVGIVGIGVSAWEMVEPGEAAEDGAEGWEQD